MIRLFITALFIVGSHVSIKAQQKIFIKTTGENKIPVAATLVIKNSGQGYSTDSSGLVAVPFAANGHYTLVVSAVGYEEKEKRISVPVSSDTLEIELKRSDEEMEEVIVQSTRTSRTIYNAPTRVEMIEFEEIDEKNNMRPGNVAMLLHESTGIQVQQTSATSGNVGIRIQGLDGRYTQLLKDGFPNYGNFSGGLSVLEIPPLDLKQVEIIKGPVSPLFGGGAIAGVINFVSKTPVLNKPEYHFILNQSNIGQSNVGVFLSSRGKEAGYTMLALYNRQSAYDVDKDDFTEVPKSNELTLHPKVFFYPDENTTIQIGNSLTLGKRTGGDVFVIKNKADASHQYFEENKTIRNISTFQLQRNTGLNKTLVVKQSFSVFDRKINIPGYLFSGADQNAFTDVSWLSNVKKHAWVVGGNFIYSTFRERERGPVARNYRSLNGGLYAQHTLDATENIILESGLRIDWNKFSNRAFESTEVFILPRISLLVKYNDHWSTRVGGGMGYKTPTIFNEETESIQYRNIAPLNNVHAEKSIGGTADINFRNVISNNLSFSFNHMFFYTVIEKPLVLSADAFGIYSFANASNPVHSAGFETNARFIFKDYFKLFLGYTFTEAKAEYLSGNQFLPLVPRHKLNSALIYEKEGVIKLGLEGYFTGRLYLSDGTHTPAFSEFGFMAEKIFRKFSLYINFENFTDTRQSRYKSVVNGSHLFPSFDQIWTHTEGFVVNGGIKIRL